MRTGSFLICLLAIGCQSTEEPWSEPSPPPAVASFSLEVENVFAGRANAVHIAGAPAMSTVLLGYSTAGVGQGPCPSSIASGCLGILAPVDLVPVAITTDVRGEADISLVLPRSLGGSYVGMQAAVLAGPGRVSNAVGRTIHPVGARLPRDADSDGDGFTIADGDCDDADRRVYPGAPDQVADGFDDDCDGLDDADRVNQDGDGYDVLNGDCDDLNDTIHPSAPEWPNGRDEDCDGIADEGTVLFDNDGDGFCAHVDCTPQPTGIPLGGDCNDNNPAIHPDAVEVCHNGVDDDCTGAPDDGEDSIGCSFFYADVDADGFGDPDSRACLCQATDSYVVDVAGDCDDASASSFPGQSKWSSVPRADGSFDFDCNGQIESRYVAEEYTCGCEVFVGPVPVVIIPFEAGWESVPACGETGTWVASCVYASASVDPLGLCIPLAPEVRTDITRTQECR